MNIKRYYLNLLNKKKNNFIDTILYGILYLFSFIYGFIVFVRNALYDLKIFSVYTLDKKVISIGNISWGGTGKTTLVSYIHKKLSLKYPIASITKGYARDEFLMLKEELSDVFDARDRVSLVDSLKDKFDIFILDDGLQYRKLKRDLDIVILTEREFNRQARLIPAGILREPISSLKRAHIVVINYWRKIGNLEEIRNKVLSINQKAKIYLADYIYKGFVDRNKENVSLSYFKNRKAGVLTAIGYPKGFIDILVGLGINIGKKIIYPDHYDFSPEDVSNVENDFQKDGISDIIITYKDYYHLDFKNANLNYFIMEAALEIENEEDFLREVVTSCPVA